MQVLGDRGFRTLVFLLVVWISGSCAWGGLADKLKPGDSVEVFYLEEWRVGTVVAVDGKGNARVKFQFAGQELVQDFAKMAIRMPHESGAIYRTRTYTDATGKHKIKAALLEITDDSIRVRKEDSKELKVKLEKLSEADQKFIRSLVAQGIGKPVTSPASNKGKDDSFTFDEPNPKEDPGPSSDPSPSLDPDNGSTSSKPSSKDNGKFPLPSKKAQIVVRGDESWNLASEPAQANGKSLAKQSAGFPMGWAPVKSLLTPDCSKVYQFESMGELQAISLVDLSAGKYSKLGDQFPGHEPLDVSNDGSKILFGHQLNTVIGDELYLYQIGNNPRLLARFRPLGNGNLFWAAFLDDDHIIVSGLQGELGVWRLSEKKHLWWIITRPGHVPGISPSGKVVFAQTPEYLVALDALTGKVLGQVRSNHEGMRVLSPSPDGRKLVGAGNGIVKVWDLVKGKLESSFAASPIMRSPHLIHWLNTDQVLIDVSIEPAFASLPTTMFDLIDLKNKAVVGAYHSDSSFPSNRTGAAMWMYSRDNRNPRQAMLSSPSLPHADLSSKVSTYVSSFAIDLKPGSSVSVELEAAPEFDREKELEDLKSVVTRAGFRVVDSNGEATFWGVLRSKDVNNNVTLNNNQDPKPPHELLLKKGNELLWAATSDVKLNVESNWQAYAIPPVIRVNAPKKLPVYGRLDPQNNFTLMDHNRIFFEGMSFRNGSGGPGRQ